MKKLIILIFFLFCICCINESNETKMTMANINSNTHYELIFDNEMLNIRNFKLKLGLFTSYDYNITKVYINYNENIKEYFKDKEYFSFDSSNFNKGIENLKEEYNLVLKNNYLYKELDEDINDVLIKKVEIYASEEAIIKFKNKYPLATIRNIP